MLITKRQDVTKPGFCKILWRKLRLRRSLLLVLIQFFFSGRGGVGRGNGWCGSGLLFEFEWEGGGLGVGAYSNKYGKNLSRQFLPSPRKAIPSLHRTLATGQKHSIKTRNFLFGQYSWNYISAKTVTYMQHINSHLALNIHQSLILKSVLLILIFRSCEIYYRTLWKDIFEIFLFKEGF